ncbi:MAG TPA: TAT-variant-translocated molybdopterin oxidoreductase, partial [Edaphobacter sp.]
MAETNSVAAETTEAVAAGKKKLSLAEVRARLDGKTGRRFWKNLDELAATPEFHELMQEEFPRQAGAGEWVDAVSRRGFLKVMGASFALAGLAGCTKQPDEPIFPYVKQPEDLVLGKPMFFASAYPFPTGAIPVLVKSEAFRPIKVNGNPEHPASNGASDTFTQATLLDLYDPDRSQHVLNRGQVSSFSKFQEAFLEGVTKLPGGQGLYFLSETVTSPTLAAQWKEVQAKYPQAKFVQWEPVNQDSSRAASKAALGSYADAQYKLEDADVILALDSDFLGGINQPGFLTLAAGYGERHMYEEGKKMNRLYAVESMPTSTGMRAEHRLSLKPSQIEGFADALVYGIAPTWLNEEQKKFFNVMLADLKKNPGRAVVIPGEQSAPSVHAAAYALNTLLGAVGKTVVYTETVNPMPTEQLPELKSLVADMKAGKVQWLVLLGTNPIYNAPVDLDFADAFNKVPNTVALTNYVDETASISTWHLNKAHYLESWSDARAYDGTISIIQPMIAPLYDGKSSHDVLQTLLADPKASAYEAVVANAKTYIKGDFATNWRKSLHDGWVADTAFAPKAGVPARVTAFPAAKPSTSGLEIAFRPDSSLYDGRFANNGWLQEIPKPITNLSWDNAALMSINTMAQLKAEETNLIELELNGRKVKAPVLMAPGHPDGVITVHLGFGRGVESGRVGTDVGFNAYALRTSDALSVATGGSAKVIDGSYYDICVTKVHNTEHRGAFAQHDLEKPQYDTQGTFSMAGHEAMERSIIRYATVEEAEKNPKFAEEGASGTLVNKVGYGPQGENPAHGDPGWDAKKHVDLSMFPDAWDYK